MDYGKLAYLKAVDLEGRRTQTSEMHVCCVKRHSLPAGESDIIRAEGKGDIAAFVSSSAPVTIFADGAEIYRGETAFFKLNGGGVVSIKSETPIDELRIMLIGDIVDYEGAGTSYADIDGDKVGYVLCENGKVFAFEATLPTLSTEKVFEGEYVQGDICAYKGAFLLALVDKNGTISVLNEREKHNYPLEAQKVAIGYGDTLTIAYIKNGSLYYFCGEFGDDISGLKKLDFKGFIDDVRVVKKSSDILFSSGGKCYIKRIFT